jgi:macrolide transport system ATP-binding/permease protein
VSSILQDLRYALRSLLRTPSLTTAAILSLGLGIGANTTVFAWVQAVLLRPVPGALEPDALRVSTLETREGRPRSWSYPNYRDWRDRATTMDVVGQDDLAMSIAVNGQPERAYGALVSGNYFRVMGVQPAAGRLLSEEDDRTPGGHPVTVISYSYWQRRFAGDPSAVGKQITVNNVPMTIIGVTPEDFLGSFLGVATAAWVPMAMQPDMTGGNRLEARGSGWMQAMARLKPGVSDQQAQAEASAVLAQIAEENKGSFDGWRIRVLPPWQANWGAPSVLAPILGVLSVVVGLVLLIACANVANLLLARAVGRRREIAVRLSLGANRWRLVRQLLTEALLLSTVAGIIGMAVAYWTYGLLMAFAPPTDLPLNFGLKLDAVTITYAAVASLLTGVFFGLAPALQTSRADTINAIKEEAGRGASGGRSGHRLRNALVVAQVAVCLVLLVGATLFVRSLQAAQQIDPGFDPDGLLIASVDLVPNGYTPDTGRQFHRRLVEAMSAVPGVDMYALARQVPLGLTGTSSAGITIDGYTPQADEEVNIVYNIVGPRYFATMRIPISAGREFTEADARGSSPAMIINETMAKRYWSNREALGGRVRMGKEDYTVVGIARDIKYGQINEAPQPYMYLALDQNFTSTAVLHVRTASTPATTLAAIRDVVRTLDPNLPLFDARTVEEHMRFAVFAQRMGANLLGVMGLIAVVLAAVGLYGVIAYAVSQRTQEMGIRLALGAAPGDLLKMVLRQGLVITSIGLAVGLTLAFVATGFMRTLLPGIAPRDPLTFVAVPVALMAIAIVAALIPARRAGAVDPVIALRYE